MLAQGLKALEGASNRDGGTLLGKRASVFEDPRVAVGPPRDEDGRRRRLLEHAARILRGEHVS